MIAQETLAKIRQLEITTRRLLSGSMVGDSRSAIKGSGFEFDQIRDYLPGDDIRFIDWKSSARTNKMLVKQYIEERSRCVIIALDVSASAFYSSSFNSKYDVMAQVAGVLALVADYGKDLTSLIMFSDTVEWYAPPAKGLSHTHELMRAAFEHKPGAKKTALKSVLRHIGAMRRRDAIVFLISDCIDGALQDAASDLNYVAKKNDLIVVRVTDQFEHALPNVGFITMQDLEIGQELLVDTRANHAKPINKALQQRMAEQDSLFKKYGISCLDIAPNKSFMGDLVRFFRRRMMY